ncbi:unnamed protein product [Cyclocybe aegerita]|uniref:Nucleic acid-binding protein n=1 Tax=Cyclocybe aegerita TaxID=1973307 RepID=A0A8S0WW58_CYCAE|nr:unnamed protein product [Cyclocybe aegerita]
MFSALRAAAAPRELSARVFSTTPRRASDLAKLVLIGRLARDPEARLTKNEREYIAYTVATTTSPPTVDSNGERQYAPSTFHRVLSFNEGSNRYLRTLKKGSKVYVEAAFELKEPEAGADPTTPQGQRQIFLKHETIRVVTYPNSQPETSEPDSEHGF